MSDDNDDDNRHIQMKLLSISTCLLVALQNKWSSIGKNADSKLSRAIFSRMHATL